MSHKASCCCTPCCIRGQMDLGQPLAVARYIVSGTDIDQRGRGAYLRFMFERMPARLLCRMQARREHLHP